jgi:hypothetical protein
MDENNLELRNNYNTQVFIYSRFFLKFSTYQLFKKIDLRF